MGESSEIAIGAPGPLRVAAGKDRFDEYRRLGINRVDFKLCPQDSNGILILEANPQAKGGPERHLHHEQDEWFYPMQGEYLFEIGTERFALGPGDAVLAPRRVPHVWAYAGSSPGKMLIVFNPAGKMEEFFREAAKAGRMPGPDADLWRAHGMEWLGPPLAIE